MDRIKEKLKGFKFTSDQCEYEISGTDDPYTLILYWKDGKPFGDNETIPRGFYEMGLSVALMEREKEGFLIFDYVMSNRLSEDKKLLIMKFVVKMNSLEGQRVNKQKRLINRFLQISMDRWNC